MCLALHEINKLIYTCDFCSAACSGSAVWNGRRALQHVYLNLPQEGGWRAAASLVNSNQRKSLMFLFFILLGIPPKNMHKRHASWGDNPRCLGSPPLGSGGGFPAGTRREESGIRTRDPGPGLWLQPSARMLLSAAAPWHATHLNVTGSPFVLVPQRWRSRRCLTDWQAFPAPKKNNKIPIPLPQS